MVDVDDSCQLSADSQPKSIGLVWGGVGGHPALSLRSSDEPGALAMTLVMMTAPWTLSRLLLSDFVLCRLVCGTCCGRRKRVRSGPVCVSWQWTLRTYIDKSSLFDIINMYWRLNAGGDGAARCGRHVASVRQSDLSRWPHLWLSGRRSNGATSLRRFCDCEAAITATRCTSCTSDRSNNSVDDCCVTIRSPPLIVPFRTRYRLLALCWPSAQVHETSHVLAGNFARYSPITKKNHSQTQQ